MGFNEDGAGERLEPWCRGNELGWVFDGEEHVLDFDQRLVGVDVTAIKETRPGAVCAVPSSVLGTGQLCCVSGGRLFKIWYFLIAFPHDH